MRREIAGILLLMMGLYVGFDLAKTLSVVYSIGGAAAIGDPLPYIIKTLIGIGVFFGGVFTILGKPGGVIFATIGCFLASAISALVIMQGGDKSIYVDELIIAVVSFVSVLFLFTSPRLKSA